MPRSAPLILSALLALSLLVEADDSCDKLSFNDTSVVCRCNIHHCDTFPALGVIPANYYTVYSSTLDGDRFLNQTLPFSTNKTKLVKGRITVDTSEVYQSIIGFGGAITDAASINIFSLSSKVRQKLLESYYSPAGIEYTLGRVPIGSADFSTHSYSYDDIPNDLQLRYFSLVTEDLHYKIPVLKSAIAMSKRPIKLLSSPWSSPYWMKTSNSTIGRGFIKGKPGGEYYKSWANYLVKFLDEYKAQGIDFWGMTAQNEPLDGRIPGFSFQCLGFTAEMQRDFIASDLGPALHAAGYEDLKLMIFDDSILELPGWAETIYGNATASQYVSGVAMHWYMNGILPYSRMSETHRVNPDKFILSTEACAGSFPLEQNVVLGSWERAEQYADDIIQDLENWVTGWTDWNIALNMSGGPNWVNNNVDSPIIVNAVKDEFYKQPMFYTMGHFSKFLSPNSVRHSMKITDSNLSGVVFSTPEKRLVMILYNKSEASETVEVVQSSTNRTFTVKVKPRSINTVIWNL